MISLRSRQNAGYCDHTPLIARDWRHSRQAAQIGRNSSTSAPIAVMCPPARTLSACLPLARASQAPFRKAKVSHPRKARREPIGGVYSCPLSFFCKATSVTKLYVGNLPFTATEDGVRTIFAAHGTVEKVSLINDRETGRPRGFGFVEMSNSDASRAMQALNGKDFDGRALKVNEAQEKSGGGGGGRGGAPRRF